MPLKRNRKFARNPRILKFIFPRLGSCMHLGWKGRAGKASFVCCVYSGNPVEGAALAVSPS